MATNCPISSFSNFGWSIDINKLGSGLLIGAPKTNIVVNYQRKNHGTAWFYAKYKDTWRKYPFTSPGFIKNGEFGKSVAVNDNNLLAIGEPYYSNTNLDENPFDYGFGAVHLYKFNNTAFPTSEVLGLLTGSGKSLSQFGYSIDLNSRGDILVVGAPTDVTNNITGGKVYIYKNNNNNWGLEHTLTGSNHFGYFGKCVKINNGDNLSPSSLIVVAENKFFHIYDYNNNVITKKNTFDLGYDNFQTTYNHNYNKFIDTDIEGNRILIGNPYESNGLAKLYARTSDNWVNIFNFNGDTNFQFFGASVGLSNTTISSTFGLDAPDQPFSTEETVTSFKVNWNSVPGATYYLLDVSTTPNFSNFVSSYNNFIVGRTNQLLTGLTIGTTYYIRVRAGNINSVSAYSPTLIKTVGVFTPDGLFATNIQTNSFTANWSPVANAFNYRLDVSTVSNFATRLVGYDGLTVNGTSQSITGLTAGTTYYVRVRAVNSSGSESANSNTLTQITVPEAPNQPTFSNVTSTSFTASWNNVTGATGYVIDIATTSDFLTNFSSYLRVGLNINITGLSPNTTYYLRVRAVTGTGGVGGLQSANSPIATQTTLSTITNAPTATNITTTGFTANWDLVTSATSYRLDVSTVSNFATRLVGYDGLTVNGTSQSITGLTAGTTYYVRVRTVNSSGVQSANSNTLTQSTVPVAPNAPTISSVTAATFTASWNSVTGASEYRIDVATTDDFTDGFATNYNDRLVSETSVSVIGLSSGTTYYVRVRARNTLTANIVTSASSLNAEGVTVPSSPSTPTATNITTTSLTANWNSITGATSYRLDVSTVSNFATRLAGYDGLTVNGTSQSITGLTAGTTYYVRVRTVNSSGVQSANSNTLTQSTVPVAPNAPTISSVTAATFTAEWNSVTGASEYRIDVATTSDFTSGFATNYNDRLVSGTSVSVIGLNSNTTYYVRVRARNTLTANTVTSAPSPNAEQVTLPLAPSALTATNITTTSFTANWGSVTGATSYRLDVSTVSNFATRLAGYDGLTVNGTSQSITGLTAGTTYYVRVRTVNSSGVQSANSNTLTQSTVPVAPNAPTISSVTAATFTAEWNSVTGASEYRIDVATTSDFTSGFATDGFINYNNRLVLSSNSPRISVIGLIPGTTYYVRVRAINSLTANTVTSANSPSTNETTLEQLLLGVSSSNDFYEINLSSKTSQIISTPIVDFSSINGLAYDNIRNQVFFISPWFSNPNLYCWHRNSNKLINLGLIATAVFPTSTIPGLAYYNNTLYGSISDQPNFFKISLNYGELIVCPPEGGQCTVIPDAPNINFISSLLFNSSYPGGVRPNDPQGGGGDLDIDERLVLTAGGGFQALQPDLYAVNDQWLIKVNNLDAFPPSYTRISGSNYGQGIITGNLPSMAFLGNNLFCQDTNGNWFTINKNDGALTNYNFNTIPFTDICQFRTLTP